MKEDFPKLFSIACRKEAWLANNMQFSNGIYSMECIFSKICTRLGGRFGDCVIWYVLFSQMQTKC